MVPAKVAAGVRAPVLVIGGGYGIYDSVSWIIPTDYVILSKSSENSSHGTAAKAGKDYGRYLIVALEKKNETWWKWSYRWWN